jgi:hypothetical protein
VIWRTWWRPPTLQGYKKQSAAVENPRNHLYSFSPSYFGRPRNPRSGVHWRHHCRPSRGRPSISEAPYRLGRHPPWRNQAGVGSITGNPLFPFAGVHRGTPPCTRLWPYSSTPTTTGVFRWATGPPGPLLSHSCILYRARIVHDRPTMFGHVAGHLRRPFRCGETTTRFALLLCFGVCIASHVNLASKHRFHDRSVSSSALTSPPVPLTGLTWSLPRWHLTWTLVHQSASAVSSSVG